MEPPGRPGVEECHRQAALAPLRGGLVVGLVLAPGVHGGVLKVGRCWLVEIRPPVKGLGLFSIGNSFDKIQTIMRLTWTFTFLLDFDIDPEKALYDIPKIHFIFFFPS